MRSDVRGCLGCCIPIFDTLFKGSGLRANGPETRGSLSISTSIHLSGPATGCCRLDFLRRRPSDAASCLGGSRCGLLKTFLKPYSPSKTTDLPCQTNAEEFTIARFPSSLPLSNSSFLRNTNNHLMFPLLILFLSDDNASPSCPFFANPWQGDFLRDVSRRPDDLSRNH